jgi:adenylate cyclase
MTEPSNRLAQHFLERATELDPALAEGHAFLAAANAASWMHQWTNDAGTLERGIREVNTALELDPTLAWAHGVKGLLHLLSGQFSEAVAASEVAVKNDGSDAMAQLLGAHVLRMTDHPQSAWQALKRATRLDPFHALVREQVGVGHLFDRVPTAAEPELKRALAGHPRLASAHVFLIVTHMQLGETELARHEASELLRLNPEFTLEQWQRRTPIVDTEAQQRFLSALRQAGLS